MTILNVAFDRRTARTKALNWRAPSIVRCGERIASRHACATGCASDGMTSAKSARWDGGAVGARSGWPVAGLLQTPAALALADRNERSSRKKSSAARPQRKRRYRPVRDE